MKFRSLRTWLAIIAWGKWGQVFRFSVRPGYGLFAG